MSEARGNIIMANTRPLVTVIVPSYNAGSDLKVAIESIIYQNYKELEILVVDDGSTDNSTDFILELNDSRIRLIKQNNGGKSVAMNRAIWEAKGKYMMLQDADDISYPNRVSELISEMELFPQVGMVFSGYDLLINDRVIAPTFSKLEEGQCKQLIDQFKMPGHDPTIMVRMDVATEFQYDPDFRIGQGLDFVLRVGERYPLRRVGACLYTYRIVGNSATRKSVAKRSQFINRVLAKAYTRRGLPVAGHLLKDIDESSIKLTPSLLDNNIAAHFIDSVIDLRTANKQLKAIVVACFCAKLQPFSLHYYKALVYSIVPKSLIQYIRRR